MKVSHATDVGKAREINEDSYYVDEEVGLFIVADGMGGHQAGEVASEVAVKTISSTIKEAISQNPKGNQVPKVIEKAIAKANEEIYTRSIGNPDLNGMGTTIVLALCQKNKVYIAHVGDSRAYMIQNNTIKQLTQDHSAVANLIKRGEITARQARIHPQRHIITRALGTSEDVEIDISSYPWQKGEYFILCSDGLTDMLEDEEIKDVVSSHEGSSYDKCRELINLANERGGQDNVTVILVFKDKL